MSNKKFDTILGLVGVAICLVGLFANIRSMIGFGIGVFLGSLVAKYIID